MRRLVPYLGGRPAGIPVWLCWCHTRAARWAAATRPRGPASRGHYARTHDRGAVIVAAGARHPGDAQRTARAWLRHRPAHRARRRAGPDLAHPPSGRLPVAQPAPGRRADHPRRRRIRPRPAADHLHGHRPGAAGRGALAGHARGACPRRPHPTASQAGAPRPRGTHPADLLQRQRAVLEPIAAAIKAERPRGKGFDATLLAWRRANAAATLDFLNDILQPGH